MPSASEAYWTRITQPRVDHRANGRNQGLSRLKALVYVVDGTVTRIRAVDPNGTWHEDDRGFADIPVTVPLSDLQIARQLPTLGLSLGDKRPHVKGKIREYLPL